MKKFALNPPCPRAPLAPGQVADPTSIKRGEDFPEEWARRQAKLARQAKEAVRKFNEDSAAVAATKASDKPRKSMAKKPAHKPSASSTVPSRPSSSATPSRPIPHAAPAPPKSSVAPAKSSTPIHLATCQRTTGISIASGVSASSSTAPNSSSGPSPKKKQVAFHVPSDDEANDEELADIIRDRQERSARAKGTNVPLLLDPKVILDYIDLWHKNPNTPMPDFHLTPGQSHVLTHFIN